MLLLIVCGVIHTAYTRTNNIQYGLVFGGGQWSSPYAKYDSSITLNSLESLVKTGATHVRILTQWYQDDINSTNIYPITNRNSSLLSPTDDEISYIINASHGLGLKTVLSPILDPNWDLVQYQSRNGWCFDEIQQQPIACQNKHTSRLKIGKYFDENEWNEWFNNYNQYILKYAQFAQQHNCFMYEAAAELLLSFNQERLWRDLVAKIRKVYSGKLTVAGYDNINFWDVLDYIGLEGYQSLPGNSIEEFKANWQQTVQDWENLTSKWNKALIITEVGYQSRSIGYANGANNARYNALDCSIIEYQCFNETLQSYAYKALFETFIDDNIKWFEGVYFWLWRTDAWQGGNVDTDFTIHGKLAEQVFYEYATGDINNSNFNTSWNLLYEYPDDLIFDTDENVVNVAKHRANGFNFGGGIYTNFNYQFGTDAAFKSLQNMKNETGANAMKILLSWRYDDYSSPYFYADQWTPTHEQLSIIFDQSYSIGINRIIFAPYLDMSFPLLLNCTYTDLNYTKPSCGDTKSWCGTLGLGWNESDWNTFFTNYNQMILSYVPLLNKYNISDYEIAGELLTMVTTHPSNFIDIINNVRNNGYKGKIMIDFNRETNINHSLFDALDYIGESAYYPLQINMSNKTMAWNNPSLDDIINAWKPIINELSNLSKTLNNKKIAFTEIGYQSRSWSWIWPAGTQELDGMDCSVWDQCYNVAHQAYLYEGLLRSVYLEDWFEGVYWWLWRSDPHHGGPVDDSFSPRGKPAAQILKKYWG